MQEFDYYLEILKTRAKVIRPVISPTLHPMVLQEVNNHRERILSNSDPKVIEDYINRATDAECLCALSEMYLNAPLNDDYYHLFAYLIVKVFGELGLDVPQDIIDADGVDLTEKEMNELESFRLGIRLSQRRTTSVGEQ